MRQAIGNEQTAEFAYLGGAVSANANTPIEITRRISTVWACLRLYFTARRSTLHPATSEIRLLKEEVAEVVLQKCVTLSRGFLLRVVATRMMERRDLQPQMWWR